LLSSGIGVVLCFIAGFADEGAEVECIELSMLGIRYLVVTLFVRESRKVIGSYLVKKVALHCLGRLGGEESRLAKG